MKVWVKIQLSDPHYTREDALLIPMMYHFYRKYFGKVDAQLQSSLQSMARGLTRRTGLAELAHRSAPLPTLNPHRSAPISGENKYWLRATPCTFFWSAAFFERLFLSVVTSYLRQKHKTPRGTTMDKLKCLYSTQTTFCHILLDRA